MVSFISEMFHESISLIWVLQLLLLVVVITSFVFNNKVNLLCLRRSSGSTVIITEGISYLPNLPSKGMKKVRTQPKSLCYKVDRKIKVTIALNWLTLVYFEWSVANEYKTFFGWVFITSYAHIEWICTL